MEVPLKTILIAFSETASLNEFVSDLKYSKNNFELRLNVSSLGELPDFSQDWLSFVYTTEMAAGLLGRRRVSRWGGPRVCRLMRRFSCCPAPVDVWSRWEAGNVCQRLTLHRVPPFFTLDFFLCASGVYFCNQRCCSHPLFSSLSQKNCCFWLLIYLERETMAIRGINMHLIFHIMTTVSKYVCGILFFSSFPFSLNTIPKWRCPQSAWRRPQLTCRRNTERSFVMWCQTREFSDTRDAFVNSLSFLPLFTVLFVSPCVFSSFSFFFVVWFMTCPDDTVTIKFSDSPHHEGNVQRNDIPCISHHF